MRKRVKDLLICYIGDEILGEQLTQCFLTKYPGISVRVGSMTGGLALARKIRFRAVIVVIHSNLTVATGVVTSRLVELGYSAKNTFVLNTCPTSRFKHQGLVHEYGRDEVDDVIEAAKRAAESEAGCCWRTQEETVQLPPRRSWKEKLVALLRRG
jgi:hypothetical protein